MYPIKIYTIKEVETARATLSVKKSDTPETIKAQYHKLSIKTHPDKNRLNPKATAEFQAVRYAYEVLCETDNGLNNIDLAEEEVEATGYSCGLFKQTPTNKTWLIDEWDIKLFANNLLLKHPRFDQQPSQQIIFWNINGNVSVTLPINGNETLYCQLEQKIIPTLYDENNWNKSALEEEIILELTEETQARLEIIYSEYKFPSELQKLIDSYLPGVSRSYCSIC